MASDEGLLEIETKIQYMYRIRLIKGKALRKHSMHKKTAASVLLKPFIRSTE